MYIVIRNNHSLNEKMSSSSYENKSINFIFILIVQIHLDTLTHELNLILTEVRHKHSLEES
jgi:hypothetical protein